ncbi:MAG TPA: hypothetical protein VIQ30_13330 [Pseudonocardia sp.]
MAFPDDPLDVTVELLLAGVWTDITQYVYLREPLTITWGRQDWASRVNPGRCPMQINNRDGQFSARNPHSQYFGVLGRNTPVRIFVTLPGGAVSYRFTGEVRSWPNRWDVSGKDRWVQVEAVGILRRLEQRNKPLYDSLRRHIEANGPLGYWPLTDGETSLQGSEIVGGGQPVRLRKEAGTYEHGQLNWGRGTLGSWLAPVVELTDATVGRLTSAVVRQLTTSWAVDYVIRGTDGGVESINLKVVDAGEVTAASPRREWNLGFIADLDDLSLIVTDWTETASSTASLGGTTLNILDGSPHHVRLSAVDNGAASTLWSVAVDGQVVLSGTHAVQNRPVSTITVRWNLQDQLISSVTYPAEAVALGHLTYWGAAVPDAVDTYQAMTGHAYELAGRRIERLCAEHGVPLQVYGDLDDTPAMGPQRPQTFLEVVRAAEEVDGGVLGEARDELALAYRTRFSRYNQEGV